MKFNKEITIGIIGLLIVTVILFDDPFNKEINIKKILPKTDPEEIQIKEDKPGIGTIAGAVIAAPSLEQGAAPTENSGSAGNSNNQQSDCLEKVDVDHDFDFKETKLTFDDILYVKLTNDNDVDYDTQIFIEDEFEGTLLVRALSQSILESQTLTNWWRSLNQITSKEFEIKIITSSCEKDFTTTIIFPPDDEAYFD